MRGAGRRAFTLIDFLVLLLVVVLIASLLLPGLIRVGDYAWVEKCQSNLRQLGEGMRAYAAANRGSFPRTRWDPSTSAYHEYTGSSASDPFAPNGPLPNDVTAAIYLLLRTGAVDRSDVFVCPLTSLSPWRAATDGGSATRFSNFPSGKYLGYSVSNPYPSQAIAEAGYAWNDRAGADFAIMADMNPGSRELLSIGARSSMSELRAANTLNHRYRRGQNVLYADGHVDFCQAPFAGVNFDNIYTVGVASPKTGSPSDQSSAIAGRPAQAADSVMLPLASGDPGALRSPDEVARIERGAATVVAWVSGVGLVVAVLYRFRRRRKAPIAGI